MLCTGHMRFSVGLSITNWGWLTVTLQPWYHGQYWMLYDDVFSCVVCSKLEANIGLYCLYLGTINKKCFSVFLKVIEHLAVNNFNVNFSTRVRNEINQHVISKIMKIKS